MRKRILMISTGGTIASVNKGNGLEPSLQAEALLSYVPQLRELCDLDCMQILNIDSTNMRPAHWLMMANTVRENYEKYDGFVITHGTDTMAYSAAALSYLLQNINKPVVLTGAQMSISEKITDASKNLLDAFTYACDDDSSGVQIVFFGSVIIGPRGRKNYAKSYMAFGSINYPEIAHVQSGAIIRYVPPIKWDAPLFYDSLNPMVGLLKLTPGMDDDVMEYSLRQYDGLIVEAFGVGGVPEYSDFHRQIVAASKAGKTIIMTTQVPNEGSDFSIYKVGGELDERPQILEAFDMTSEAALTKLMWILAQTDNPAKIRKMFYTPVYCDILTKAQ